MRLIHFAMAVLVAIVGTGNALASDSQFSTCRLVFLTLWANEACPAGVSTSANVSIAREMQQAVDPTNSAPDCRAGAQDMASDVARLIDTGGTRKACAFYRQFILK